MKQHADIGEIIFFFRLTLEQDVISHQLKGQRCLHLRILTDDKVNDMVLRKLQIGLDFIMG